MANFTSIAATTAAVANRFVTSTNMVNSTYTIANASPAWQGGCFVTVTHTTATGTDTLGTLALVGTGLDGKVQSETITPTADSLVTSTLVYRTVTSLTGSGWSITGGNDTIVVGCAAGSIVCASQGKLYAVHVNATAAATVVISDRSRTIATLASSIANGTYLDTEEGIDFAGYLKVATTSTNDITVIHSGTLPASYAL